MFIDGYTLKKWTIVGKKRLIVWYGVIGSISLFLCLGCCNDVFFSYLGGPYAKLTEDYSFLLISAAFMTTKSVEALEQIHHKQE